MAAVILLSFCFILVKSTGPPEVYDTGLYHAQAVRWIAAYPVVPGLGNLHGRLAFNSAWFLPNALFRLAFLKIPPFHALSGLLLLLVVTLSFAGAGDLLQGRYSFSNLVKVAVGLPYIFLFKFHLSSPATDLPAVLLIGATFIYYLETLENPGKGETSLDIRLAIIVVLSCFTITVKLSTLPLMIFAGYIAVRELLRKKVYNFCFLAAAGGLIFLPWLVRNIILSGYLIYPFPAIDLFHFDWKIPRQAVLREKTAIENYARNPGLISNEVVAKGISYWFPTWISYVGSAYRKKLEMMVLPSGIILLSTALNVIKTRSFRIEGCLLRKNLLLAITALAGCIFWFLGAPDLRFGIGFIIMLSLLIYLPLANTHCTQVAKTSLVLLGIFLVYFETAFLAGDIPGLRNRWLFPAPYPEVGLQTRQVGSGAVYVPAGGRGYCWDAPLPCTPEPPKGLEFRGKGLAEGFRSR